MEPLTAREPVAAQNVQPTQHAPMAKLHATKVITLMEPLAKNAPNLE